MEDDDEIDVLGEFNLESLLTKDEHQISSCYDGEHQLDLHCDSQWMLDATTQSSWYDNRSDQQSSSFGGFSKLNPIESYDNNSWSDKERYLLEKGLELFGRSWSRLAQYIGTKSSGQVKSHVKAMGSSWTGKSSVSTSSFSVDNMDFNFTDLIDDMEIPASIEEVIAAVSTAQPTVVVPPSLREVHTTSSTRKLKGRHKKDSCKSKRSQVLTTKSTEVSQLYKAEEIKDVLTSNKEQDSIVLPSGEQVIRIRRVSSQSESSDVDIDVDSEAENCGGVVVSKEETEIKQDIENFEDDAAQELSTCGDDKQELFRLPDEHVIVREELFHFQDGNIIEMSELATDKTFELFIDNIEKEVSVFTDGFIEKSQEIDEDVGKETSQVFKGDLVTPSGKVMTVIVDDMFPSHCNGSNTDDKPMQTMVSKYMSNIQERLEAVYKLPPPHQEAHMEPHVITQQEEMIHPEFFSKMYQGFNRYIKIRNHIIECWKNSKPNYVTKTSVRTGLRNCGDVNLIGRIHAYLEQRGFINFGCEQCHYNMKSKSSSSDSDKQADGVVDNSRAVLEAGKHSLRGSCRARKKKLPFEEVWKSKNTPFERTRNVKSAKIEDLGLSKWKPRKKKIRSNCNGGYTMIHMDSGEVVVQRNESQAKKMNTRGIKPVKLIHCKNYNVNNKAPYQVELEVTALVLVDVHSHLSPKSEVIGLLGGLYTAANRVLSITTAVPCRTILSTNIHCDMCPVSQCESSELITSQGLSVVGWYHSHPNFVPSPSDTDVDTQNTLQSWFNETGKPFVGLIISPYFSVHSFSSYRCCQVKMENSGPTPYQLDVKLTNLSDNNKLALRHAMHAAYKTLQKLEPVKQAFFHKCLESVKFHLRKANPKVEDELFGQVIREVREFFKVISTKPLEIM